MRKTPVEMAPKGYFRTIEYCKHWCPNVQKTFYHKAIPEFSTFSYNTKLEVSVMVIDFNGNIEKFPSEGMENLLDSYYGIRYE